MTVEIKVHGMAEIRRALEELGTQAASRVARSALNRAATPVVKRAKELAPQPGDSDDPHSTGALRKAIAKRLRRQRRGSDKQVVVIGLEKPVSRRVHFVEFGTRFMRPEPFLRPALDERVGEVLRIMREAMAAGIQREVAKAAQKFGTMRKR
jgi:HK97 gp10 family phage protein